MICRKLQKQKLTRKKNIHSSHSATERVQIYMCEYWKKVKNIDPDNLVFLEKVGVLLGLAVTHARLKYGSIVYNLQRFYSDKNHCRGNNFKKIVGLMTLAGLNECQGFCRLY